MQLLILITYEYMLKLTLTKINKCCSRIVCSLFILTKVGNETLMQSVTTL